MPVLGALGRAPARGHGRSAFRWHPAADGGSAKRGPAFGEALRSALASVIAWRYARFVDFSVEGERATGLGNGETMRWRARGHRLRGWCFCFYSDDPRVHSP